MPRTSRGPRARDAAPPTDDQLIGWFDGGELLDRIIDHFSLPEMDQFRDAAERCGELSAAGKMDILTLIENGEVAAVGGPHFFTVQHFYNEALPSLTEPFPRMLAAVGALVKQGGADMASNLPNAALREWLQKDPTRAEAIVAAAEAGDPAALDHLCFALEVIGDPARARVFLMSNEAKTKAIALTALTRTPDPDAASRTQTLQAIEQALGDGSDDMLCANAVHTLLALLNQDPAADPTPALPALRTALSGRGGGVINRAAHGLWEFAVAQQADVAAVLLEALLDLDPEHKQTVDQLDMGLKALFDADADDQVLAFLAKLVIKVQGRLKIRAFNSVWDTVVSGPADRLSRWLVAWMTSGEHALEQAASEVLSRPERSKTALAIDRTALPTSSEELGYLARKAVGWFMLQPELATSLLVAILGVCSQPTAREVAGLLAFPVLRNYPEARGALDAVPATDPAKPWTDAALQAYDEYSAALRAVPAIPELLPSEHNRRIQHLHRVDMMRAIQKSAQKQSVFYDLVHHSTLLYGVRSLSYVEDLGGGARRPMEMELGSHEFSMVLPRLEMLDPIGLQLMLVHFRREARPE